MKLRKAWFAMTAVGSMTMAATAFAQSESERFRALLDEEWAYTMREFPEWASSVGYPGQNDRWTDWSEQAIESRERHMRELLERLGGFNRESLEEADRLNYDLYRREIAENVEGQRFPDEYLPVTPLAGVHQTLASTLMRTYPRTLEDFEDMVTRLERADGRIAREIGLLKRGLELGVTPPRVTLRDVPDQVQRQIIDDPMESPLIEWFKRMPGEIPSDDRERLTRAAATALKNGVFPALDRFREFLVEEYLPQTSETIGLSELFDGQAWYAYSARVYTTSELSPQEIHRIGLSEVKRIRAEMQAVMRRTEFEGSFERFLEYLRTDSKFFYDDGEDLMMGYRDVAKRIDPGLVRLFGTLPRLPYGVREIPEYSAPSQTTAYYEPGSPEAARPGYFFANTYNLKARPKWEMEALTLHEAVPGHHLQIALAQELEGLPEFRKHGGYTAFIEGWGLYAESLGEELGMYQDAYSKFGQLTYEMWRAVRLVVDTGMHSMGWSREKAIDFFAENSSKPLHDITVEIDRYITWPGQALAYKIGELKFKELKARAKEALGESFDVRAFHDALLSEGALPLDILETRFEQWLIKERARNDTK